MYDYMEIVIGPDENYAMPCGVMIKSILYTNPGIKIRFHIISENLSDKSKKILTELLNNTQSIIIFYAIDSSKFNGLPAWKNSFATYTILFIADILPEKIKKVLYFDADMITVNTLTDLWSIDITDYPIAGAISIMHDDIRNYNRLDYDGSKGYYNIGTHIINLDYWRKNKVLEECISYIQTYPDRIKFYDQDVLNVILMDKWKKIHAQFNCFQNYYMPIDSFLIKKELHEEIEYARMNPVVIHFISNPKPWHKEYIMPLTKIWRFFFKMTPWGTMKLPYYYHGIEHLKYKIKQLFVMLHILKPDVWNADFRLNMTVINEIIYNQITSLQKGN